MKSPWKELGVDIRNILFDRTLPKNVYLRKNRYEVTLQVDGKTIYGGRYKELAQAIQQRDKLFYDYSLS